MVLIWLSQSAYIDKISNFADTRQFDQTPMSREELLSYIERAPRNTSLTITKGAQRDIETSQWDYNLEVVTSVL